MRLARYRTRFIDAQCEAAQDNFVLTAQLARRLPFQVDRVPRNSFGVDIGIARARLCTKLHRAVLVERCKQDLAYIMASE